QSLVSARLQHVLIERLVRANSIFGLCKSSHGLGVLVLLAPYLRFCHQILVISGAVLLGLYCIQLGLRLVGVSKCEIVIGEADAHRGVRRSSSFGALEVRLR